MKIYQKHLSLLLVVVLFFTAVNVAFAGFEEVEMKLDVSTVPEVLNADDMIEAGHIQRDYSSESSLHSVAFKNQDGSGALYFFEEPIKYIDENGNQKDKNNTLVKTSKGHTNPNNDINIIYPDQISKGLEISYKGYSIAITPIRITDPTTMSFMPKKTLDSESSITYSNAFADNIDINYTQLYSGMKESIIINEKTDVAKFSYIISTDGLTVTESDGKLNFIDSKADSIVMTCGKLLSWDSNDYFGYANYEVTPLKPNQTYIITINAEDFLSDKELTYPVTIDPSYTFDFETMYRDVTIFTTYKKNFGEYFTMFIGNFNSRYKDNQDQEEYKRGTARVYVTMPGVITTSIVQDLYNEGRITSVKYTFVDRGNDVNTKIQAYMCTKSWDEATVTYSSDPSLWNSYHTMLDKATISVTDTNIPRYELDITAALDTWMKDPSQHKGIMLKAEDESKNALICYSREAVYHGQSYNRIPYVKVEYCEQPFDGKIVRFKNVSTGKYLTVDSGYKYSGQNVSTKTKITGIEDKSNKLHSNSQKFRIRYDSNLKAYRIYAMCSMYGRGTVLDVLRTSDGRRALEAGCNVETYSPGDNEAQLFQLVSAGNGQYYIKLNKNTNLVIDGASNDAKLATYSSSSTTQKWVIEMVDNDADYYYSHLGVNYPFIDNYVATITSCYGYRSHSISCHPGTDIARNEGTAVYSLFNGIIIEEGYVAPPGKGNYVIVEATDEGYEVFNPTSTNDAERPKLRFCYMHMKSRVTTFGYEVYNPLKNNDSGKVTTNKKLGEVGNTGLKLDNPKTGYHLHITIITDKSSTTDSFDSCMVDPMVFFPNVNFIFDLVKGN